MQNKPGWRRAYDAVEQAVTPRVESIVHGEEFRTATKLAGKAQRLVGRSVNGATARLWHLANLPAGSDVQRLRKQVASLDREVRRLTLQLERTEEGHAK